MGLLTGPESDLPYTDPHFLQHVCDQLVLHHPPHSLYQFFDLKEEAFYSLFFDLSGLQESASFRALRRARLIAHAVIDDQGDWDLARLTTIRQQLSSGGDIF